MLRGELVGEYPLWVIHMAGLMSVQISNPGVWSFVVWLL